MVGRPPVAAEIRFFSKVEKTKGCWNWTGSVLTTGLPYGQFRDGKRMWKAHRWSYTYHFGAIPNGKHVMHSCDNPRCVNPLHLSIGTALDNTRDMIRKGRRVLCFGVKNFFYGKNPNHYRKLK